MLSKMNANQWLPKTNLSISPWIRKRIGDIEDKEIQKTMKNRPYEKLRITEIKLESDEIKYLISNFPMEKLTTND